MPPAKQPRDLPRQNKRKNYAKESGQNHESKSGAGVTACSGHIPLCIVFGNELGNSRLYSQVEI